MKEIEVRNTDRPALVDDEDYDRMMAFTWIANRHRKCDITYAQTWRTINGKQQTIRMHRLITEAPAGLCVDHINHDGLDNRRSNLRVCKTQENSRNRRKLRPKTSKYKGVHRRRESGKWQAVIRSNDAFIRIGSFPTEELAAAAYNQKARELFGQFAALNDVPESLEAEANLVVHRYRTEPQRGSGLFGVTFHKTRKLWMVSFNIFGGYYKDKEEAAKAYNKLVSDHALPLRVNKV